MRVLARLVVTTPHADGLLFLRGGRHLIGRQEDCDLIIPHPDVSRRHAVVEVNDDSASIVDQGSRNGTWVNGVAVTRGDLAHGCHIRLGSTPCVFEWLTEGGVCGDEPTPACAARAGPDRYLTPAQQKVLACLLDGLSEKAAAGSLSVSRNTVHNHVKQIYLFFGVNSRAELLAQVLRR